MNGRFQFGRVYEVAIASLFSCCLAVPVQLSGQSPPAQQQKQPDQQRKPGGSNPFPDDTTNVPVIPNSNSSESPDIPSRAAPPPALPGSDSDPVRSPDDPVGGDNASEASGFSSSSSGLDRVTPPPDAPDAHPRKGARNQPQAPIQAESAKQDESVGNYYLSSKNWKAALSRFESAVVLDPENPDVYWGLAEAQRHLGDFAKAKANYSKVMEYDPDSKHAKEAKRLLTQPELANAPLAAVPHARE